MTVDLSGRIYLGIVEDNNDPDRENKCRIRVINIFDGIPLEDIPWATPWKDTSGVKSDLPDVNKVVSVEFEGGDIYSPVYRYAEHYNVNLENKLKSMDESDYLSMKALQFDHMTQIYSNESEGLKLDHKFNMVNITDNTINLNLKSNLGKINIGTADSDQQSILGNNFLDWFDGFVSHLLGEGGGPYFGNLYTPVVANPSFIKHLNLYRASKDPKFLSHNVFLNDNGDIADVKRPSLYGLGDTWTSTVDGDVISGNGGYSESDYSVNFKTHSDSNLPDADDAGQTIAYVSNGGSVIREKVSSGGDSTNSSKPTPNADRLRRVMGTVGYIEKGYSLSSYGDITADMALYAINVFTKIKELYPHIKCRVTSGNDKFHQGLKYNSRHKSGRAVDFTIIPANRTDVNNVVNVIMGFVAVGKGNARFLNEYKNPTAAATGNHIHLSWGAGTEGNALVSKSIAAAKSGSIRTYAIKPIGTA